MSKKRVSTYKRSTSGTRKAKLTSKQFLGVALSGGKADKTCLAFIDYFPRQKKIVLKHVDERLRADEDISADLILYDEICKNSPEILAYNVPLTLPKCMSCRLSCPGYEVCDQEEILWMWDHHRKLEKEGRSRKVFTPYTERCVEQYLATELEEPFHLQHALGANMAPLTARAHFLNRRLKTKTIEVFPRLSLWRIGRSLQIQKSYLRFHKHQLGGDEARHGILQEFVRRKFVFMYEQDVRLMTRNADAFDAFLCALTAVLKYNGMCEDRPQDFPKKEGWIEVPQEGELCVSLS